MYPKLRCAVVPTDIIYIKGYYQMNATPMLEIRHHDAQSSPIGQYIVIYLFQLYIIYAHLMDRISILLLIVGQ